MTSRGWWCLATFAVMLAVGALRGMTLLSVTGLALLLWFAWEWLFFTLRLRMQWGKLRVERLVRDDRGPVTTLWQGRDYSVVVSLRLGAPGRFPYVAIADPVPFGARHQGGETVADGELKPDQPIELAYQVGCPLPGVARFEGVRVEVSDLQGFFSHVGFVRNPVVLPILPGVQLRRGGGATLKRHNELMPPGIHRLRQPGSGSELLDLRDYLPGDPPRTIAWKVSARRDRLITKEFESEVPIRCTLFVDVSSSVRVASPAWSKDDEGPAYYRPLDRLIELAAGVIRANTALRDLTGLCLFDEQSSRLVRPERGANHVNKLMRQLGDAAALGPAAARADADRLLPLAYAFAQEVYPDLLRPEVNAMPAWLTWLVGMPRYTRHRRGVLDALHRSKRSMLLWGTTLIPLALFVANVAGALTGAAPEWAGTLLGAALFLGTPLLVAGTWLVFVFSLLVSARPRRRARWRKRLAALMCVLEARGGSPLYGALDLFLEDDDLFSLHLQRFLADHQVPCAVPLYDEQGRYLFALPEKVGVLAKALLHSVSRGRDNELFVLLADLLELDDRLDPLLHATRVALGRHHQVLVVCPWPQDVPLPDGGDRPPRSPGDGTLPELVLSLTEAKVHAAYHRVRRAFARLGVQVVCAGSDESVPLVLDRIERLRGARITAGGWK
ncbi:MAG: DUF58 domain-containing protein [Gemmataceae bacterium]